MDRVIRVAAGLGGAAGVAASAAGSHAYAGTSLDTAGKMLLIHAAALIALSVPAVGSNRIRHIASLVMLIGVALFSGDLTARAVLGGALFPLAAPLGGLLMMAGWLIAALACLGGRRN
ncbi:DUF423 domain-containing protein [Chthonobacter rhizosphaerae]|uniref:DUF423 domain-containing protein n=1 Tax=Chthonobacter rhizosphaerae TaxID=2735553 RepID=UPI001FE6E4ED|nr:DUF423 domain-containing protein [Chthonobacter rhizosphaerae]